MISGHPTGRTTETYGRAPTRRPSTLPRRRTSGAWQTSVFLNGDVPQKVSELKQQQGPDLHVWGSSNLLQTLIRHDLVDTFWLMIYPVTLGTGKRLFADGTIPAAFTVTESTVSPKGVIVVIYERVGAITTGRM